ncbi:hypothetical protein ThrDRAFT_01538 [Frankia casuarinae]|nr:hypothetical protein ThrDRAFT_01538 [Frankia casuarinae]KDA42054.1 hypothetical protein BMG523Draft_03065 [Frankia sp. BMG5.23]
MDDLCRAEDRAWLVYAAARDRAAEAFDEYQRLAAAAHARYADYEAAYDACRSALNADS